MDPADVSAKIDLGKIHSKNGYLSLSLTVDAEGAGKLFLYIEEQGKRSGQIMSLNLDDYNQLRAIIKKTDETLTTLGKTGKLKKLGSE